MQPGPGAEGFKIYCDSVWGFKLHCDSLWRFKLHCDSLWDSLSTEIPAQGDSRPFPEQQDREWRGGRWCSELGQCVTVTATSPVSVCTAPCVCVCVCVQAPSHNSVLHILHPYYVSLFFIMIYTPCHGFIMIYAPIPRRAYGRHHTAKRQQPCSGEETWLCPRALMLFPSQKEPHSWPSTKGFGSSCTKASSQAFIQTRGPQFLLCCPSFSCFFQILIFILPVKRDEFHDCP